MILVVGEHMPVQGASSPIWANAGCGSEAHAAASGSEVAVRGVVVTRHAAGWCQRFPATTVKQTAIGGRA